MNKAFSLFETILVLILIGFLALFLSRTLWEFYYLNNQQLKMKDLILKTHLSVLRLEKLLQTCTNITFEPNHISCLLKDDLLYLDDNKEKLLNSVGGKIKCRKRKIKCRIFATNYLSFNLKLKL